MTTKERCQVAYTLRTIEGRTYADYAFLAGDRVRYAGVRIGRVQEIDLRPDEQWPVRFVVAIDPDLPIYTDATARFSTTSLLGSSFLEIDPVFAFPDAEARSPRRPPGRRWRLFGSRRTASGRASAALPQPLITPEAREAALRALRPEVARLAEEWGFDVSGWRLEP